MLEKIINELKEYCWTLTNDEDIQVIDEIIRMLQKIEVSK